MTYWRWDSGLSSAEIREQIALSVLERSNAMADGPCCSLFAEAPRQDRPTRGWSDDAMGPRAPER